MEREPDTLLQSKAKKEVLSCQEHLILLALVSCSSRAKVDIGVQLSRTCLPSFLFYSLKGREIRTEFDNNCWMENLEKRKRVRFFDPQLEEPGITGERTVLYLPWDNLEGDKKVQKWRQNQCFEQMSPAYDPQESEFAAAVAAAAFSIYSIEEDEEQYRRKRRQDLEKSKATNNEGKEDTMGGSRVIRPFSSHPKDAGEPSLPKPPDPDQRVPEVIQPSRITGRSTSMRPLNLGDQGQRGSSLGDVVVTREDSWETAQLRKIRKRYEKMASDIQAWENAKKMEAKRRMERKQNDLEAKRTVNMQHYQNKVARIDMIAGGARRQLEEKGRNEESEVQEKAKYKRMKRKSPLSCFCF